MFVGDLLVAPPDRRCQIDVPPRPPQERRFDEVVTQNSPAQRWRPRQHRQLGVADKRFHPKDGVVAPVVGGLRLPERLPSCQHRSIQCRAELGESTEEGLLTRRNRDRLDESCPRIRLHRVNERNECGAAHDAVGIEDNHEVVVVPPRLAEVGDVACLATGIQGTPSVVQPPGPRRSGSQSAPCLLLDSREIGICSVT